MDIVIAGYKSLSLVDVYGAVTFTVWFCGCNLKCPFCHNWVIAEGDLDVCKSVSIDSVLEELLVSRKLIDYLHVTGGEPLIQYSGLRELFYRSREYGVSNSLDSNLTFPDRLDALLKENLIDHVASDLKTPFNILSGLGDESSRYWSLFTESLEVLSSYDVLFELRIPVARELTIKYIRDVLSDLSSVFRKFKRMYCIVNPLMGPPLTNPRDRGWASRYCNPDYEEVVRVASIVEELLHVKTIVKKWWRVV